jgi:hypothetical protein
MRRRSLLSSWCLGVSCVAAAHAAPDAAAANGDLHWSATPPAAETLTLGATAGRFGADPVYALRLGYFALPWLGVEATLAHNPSSDVQALLHYVDAAARWRGPLRFSPFATAGLGTIHVFPGDAVNARSVTKLLLNVGGGTHFALRDDVALRLEVRSFTVVDQQEGRGGAYHYMEWSGGLTFSRPLHAPDSSEMGAEP